MILPSPILIDANALFYLDKLGLVKKVISALPEPKTTVLVKGELKVPSWKALEEWGMRWIEVSVNQMFRAQSIIVERPALSIQDASLAVVAADTGLALVTADKDLSDRVSLVGCSVMNFPEFIDGLARDDVLSESEALYAFVYASNTLHFHCDGYIKRYREIMNDTGNGAVLREECPVYQKEASGDCV